MNPIYDKTLTALDHLKRLRDEQPAQNVNTIRPNSPDEVELVFGTRAAALGGALLLLRERDPRDYQAALNDLALEGILAVGWKLTIADAVKADSVCLHNASGDVVNLPFGPLTLSDDEGKGFRESFKMRSGELAKLAALVWLDDLRMGSRTR